jgi:hypothetical protein
MKPLFNWQGSIRISHKGRGKGTSLQKSAFSSKNFCCKKGILGYIRVGMNLGHEFSVLRLDGLA